MEHEQLTKLELAVEHLAERVEHLRSLIIAFAPSETLQDGDKIDEVVDRRG